MKKRTAAILTVIISIIFAAIIIISAVSGAVRAWFTSTMSSKKNIFTSGTVVIKCNESISSGMTEIGNIYPGWKAVGSLRVENSGTIDLQYRMHIDTAGLEGNPLFDGEQPVNISIMKGDSVLKDYTCLNNFGELNMGQIKKGGYDNLIVFLELPEDADNSCQGNSIGLSFIFEGKQDSIGSAYPEEIPVSSITITGDDGTLSASPDKPLKLSAHVEPETASNKAVMWSVRPETGNAVADQSGLVEALSNGSVNVRASAADGSGVYKEVPVYVQGVTSVIIGGDLKAAMQDPDIKTIDISPAVFNIDGGVFRNGSAQNLTINCSRGEAIVNIVASSDNSYGNLPSNIKAGIGVTINEHVILVKKYSYVQAAIDSAKPNSIIAFERGVFKDNDRVISINKPLTLIGIQSCSKGFEYSNGTASIRDVFGSEIGSIEINGENASNTTIMGLDFISGTGVPVTINGSCSRVKIVNNVIKNIPDGGINFTGSCRNIVIQGNAVKGWKKDNTAAMNIGGVLNNDISICDNYILEGCTDADNTTGIMVPGGCNLRFNDNIIEKVRFAGISFSGAGSMIECRGNIIKSTACGIRIINGASQGISSINILNNNISEIKDKGIVISGTSQGAVKDINIFGNTISYDISGGIMYDAYNSVIIQLSKDAVEHGTINIMNNNFNIYGTRYNAIKVCCLYLSGKLNIVNITGNAFHDESSCLTPDGIVGIHIVENDTTYGCIPMDAAISGNLKLVNSFDVFNGIKVLDDRKH